MSEDRAAALKMAADCCAHLGITSPSRITDMAEQFYRFLRFESRNGNAPPSTVDAVVPR
jgi:hypothetical protein